MKVKNWLRSIFLQKGRVQESRLVFPFWVTQKRDGISCRYSAAGLADRQPLRTFLPCWAVWFSNLLVEAAVDDNLAVTESFAQSFCSSCLVAAIMAGSGFIQQGYQVVPQGYQKVLRRWQGGGSQGVSNRCLASTAETGITFEWITGTSVGALNVILMNDVEAAVDLWVSSKYCTIRLLRYVPKHCEIWWIKPIRWSAKRSQRCQYRTLGKAFAKTWSRKIQPNCLSFADLYDSSAISRRRFMPDPSQ